MDDAEIAGSHALRQIPVKNSFRRWSVGIISKVKRIFLGIEILLKTPPKKYTSCRVWLGKLHLETFLMNYAAGPTLVTGEGEMRKGNVLFLLFVSSGWIIFFHTICCVLQANAH